MLYGIYKRLVSTYLIKDSINAILLTVGHVDSNLVSTLDVLIGKNVFVKT